MPLTEFELTTLANHGKNHPSLQKWIFYQNWESIANWYDQKSNATVKELVSFLSLQDRVKLFQYINFQDWYSQFCQKLIDNDINFVFGYSLEQIKQASSDLLIDLIEYKLLSFSLQNLLVECFRRNLTSTIIILIICLGANRVFENYTLFLFQIELANYKRWQALQLSLAPTILECETVFKNE